MEVWQMLLIVCPLVFFAALVDAVAGGGGLISLTAYLLTGMPPALASGSNKLSACMGGVSATFTYARAGKIRWRVGLVATAGALPGASLGALLLTWLPAEQARLLLLVAIPLAAVAATVLPKKQAQRKRSPRVELLLSFLIGLVIGAYDGLIGPGTGTFMIILFSGLLGMELVEASGCAKLANLASNLGALLTMLISGNILYAVALPAAVFSLCGARVGAKLALRGGSRFIARTMYVVLGLMLIWLGWNTFFAGK